MSKLKIGWFSFSCCEDSTIVFTELMNTHFFEWKKKIDFRHTKILKSNNVLEGLDVAFIEGAIATEKDEGEVKRIRAAARFVVAIGSCAVNGGPSAQRNKFDKSKQEKISSQIMQFGLNDRVKCLSEVIGVDSEVDGCPMSEDAFLTVLDKYFTIFGVNNA
ncbi:MAG: hypothetical protein HGA85_01250 [Nanoarchaeota archaeon]|nr:hypothetical protein [Nanoarchaeota archaeon]